MPPLKLLHLDVELVLRRPIATTPLSIRPGAAVRAIRTAHNLHFNHGI